MANLIDIYRCSEIGNPDSIVTMFQGNLRLGIVRGGQLGRMLLQPCMSFGIKPLIMDIDPDAPCRDFCADFTIGDARDYNDLYSFGKKVDLLTVEVEDVNVKALYKLREEGVAVRPSPEIIQIIQDKGLQKEFFSRENIPTAEYKLVNSKEDIFALESWLPMVQKIRTSGYDGRGVKIVRKSADFDSILDGPSVLEKCVDIDKEISIIAARNGEGQVETFPAVEMVFNEKTNMLDFLFTPSSIPEGLSEKAENIAKEIVEKLALEGIIAVEMFLTKSGSILVNELAPRPHNSGHHTIESCDTSQFEQHIRAICNLPLGKTTLKSPAVMLNLVGEEGYSGPVRYKNIEQALKNPGVFVHRYGKKITRPNRKMGHITVINKELKKAKVVAQLIKDSVRIIA